MYGDQRKALIEAMDAIKMQEAIRELDPFQDATPCWALKLASTQPHPNIWARAFAAMVEVWDLDFCHEDRRAAVNHLNCLLAADDELQATWGALLKLLQR